MNNIHIAILLLSIFTQSLYSQALPVNNVTVQCDCSKARKVKVSGAQKIGPTIAPAGPGEILEFSVPRPNPFLYFEKEHHSAWYRLQIVADGKLSFDILPVQSEDDYDFILFKAGSDNFCDSLMKFPITPVRSNLSRDKKELNGKTGLSVLSLKEHVKKGVNDAYASALPVKSGEIYYLVLDNVYENGKGHSIDFQFKEKVMMKGEIKNDNNIPLQATVTITDNKGDTVAETISSKRTGAFSIETALKKNENYTINYFNDSSFVFSKTFTSKDTLALQNISTVLPVLRKGKKFAIGSINFYGGSVSYVPASKPSLNNLYRLMKKNKELKILIQGHTNGCAPGVQELSDGRAKAITNFLIDKGIDVSRVEFEGKGCQEMLYPDDGPFWQQEKNRRVEVKVLDM